MDGDGIRVFISSKQGELDTERAIAREQARNVGLVPILAEEWPPGRSAIRDVYLEKVRRCPLYLGLFYRTYSAPTQEEYESAIENPYREVLVYVRSSDGNARDKPLEELIHRIASRHVYYRYAKPEDLFPTVSQHLREALSRMTNLLLNLGEKPPGGLRFGDSSRESWSQSPVSAFLHSLDFPEGRYEPGWASEVAGRAHAALESLDAVIARESRKQQP